MLAALLKPQPENAGHGNHNDDYEVHHAYLLPFFGGRGPDRRSPHRAHQPFPWFAAAKLALPAAGPELTGYQSSPATIPGAVNRRSRFAV